ncbi:hypothetical protein [Actinoplanes sp. NPDC048796]|uniref:hypothetical protein n=1 Tax=Actinoplanes sp. NPDC048796 TaxID=3155640 RepID=UPI0033CCD95E
MNPPYDPVVALVGDPSGLEPVADILIDETGDAAPEELLARFPGAALVLVVTGEGAAIGFRDGLSAVHLPELIPLLYAWWCRQSPAQGNGPW